LAQGAKDYSLYSAGNSISDVGILAALLLEFDKDGMIMYKIYTLGTSVMA
jgi:hypothetical protein